MSLHSNILKVALRNLQHSGWFAGINGVGLVVGLTCSMFILLYVYDEYSYDRFHTNIDQLYRLHIDVETPSEVTRFADTPGPAGPNLVQDFPQIENMTRFVSTSALFEYGNIEYQEDKIFFADESVFQMFSFRLTKGNPVNALAEPMSVVLDEELADKIFGDTDPIGKTLRLVDEDMEVTITGVMESLPRTSHIHFKALFSMDVYYKTSNWDEGDDWETPVYYTYLMLEENGDASELEPQFPDFLDRYIDNSMDSAGRKLSLSLMPLEDIYLHSDRSYEVGPSSNALMIYILSVVGFLVLFTAGVNYVMLATVSYMQRYKEMGIRKTLGAQRTDLSLQYLAESLLFIFVALLLTYGVSFLLVDAFNTFSGKNIESDLLLAPSFIGVFLGVGLLFGVLAGVYPALMMSRLKPAEVLRSNRPGGSSGSRVRSALVGLQIGISILLIVGSVVVYKQIHFMESGNPGFDRENMLLINLQGEEGVQKRDILKQAYLDHPDVLRAAVSDRFPGVPANRTLTIFNLEEGQTSSRRLRFF